MVQAVYYQKGNDIDYTPVGAVSAGDVVVIGDMIAVATKDIAAGALGAVTVDGAFAFEREQATAFTAGAEVYWDENGTPEGGTATGAAVDTSDSGANEFIGFALAAAADSASVLRVYVSLKNGYARDTIAMGDLSDCGDGAPTSGDLLIGDGNSWEAEPVSGLVTLGLTGAVGLPAQADASLGLPILIQKTFADAATGDIAIYTADAPIKFRIIDVWLENRTANGANANTIQVCASAAGADAITDALALTGKVDTDVVRAATIVDSTGTIAASGSLYLRQTKAGGTMGGNVYILAIPVT